jgi:hypothetical protein
MRGKRGDKNFIFEIQVHKNDQAHIYAWTANGGFLHRIKKNRRNQ